MCADESHTQGRRARTRKRKLLLLGIGLVALLPVAGLVFSAVEYLQDRSDRIK
jgi:hypothetical protein